MPETCNCHVLMPGKVAPAALLLLPHTSLIMSAIKARDHFPGVREECQSTWHHSEQHQADGEAESGYHGNDPVVGEEGVLSISRSSLSDSGLVSGPARSGSQQQRATSAPRDRPNFRATVPRWVKPLPNSTRCTFSCACLVYCVSTVYIPAFTACSTVGMQAD